MAEPRPGRKRRWRWLLFLVPALGGLLWYGSRAVGYVATRRVFLVPTGSMAPAILPGDRVVAKIGRETPARGEIWLIDGPKSALIKRVIGLPGETVEIGGGRVLVDGKPLSEPYLAAPTTGAMPRLPLGPGEYFLMGDARATALDSRAFGPVHRSKLLGQVDYRCWPSHRIGPLR